MPHITAHDSRSFLVGVSLEWVLLDHKCAVCVHPGQALPSDPPELLSRSEQHSDFRQVREGLSMPRHDTGLARQRSFSRRLFSS